MKARGGHAYVGVIGARYVLPVLTATGHHDVAYAVATQTTEPSWGYWTDVAGFTALGEHWPATTRSRNHHFFGAIVQWFYEDLAGMRPLAPGYETIEFKPEIPRTGARPRVGVLRERAGNRGHELAPHRHRAGAGRDRARQRHRTRLRPGAARRRPSPRWAAAGPWRPTGRVGQAGRSRGRPGRLRGRLRPLPVPGRGPPLIRPTSSTRR